MKNQNTAAFPKVTVRLSRSGDLVIIQDERGEKILVNTNLMKHALGVPFKKKDGTFKSEAQINADKARAQEAYQAKIALTL